MTAWTSPRRQPWRVSIGMAFAVLALGHGLAAGQAPPSEWVIGGRGGVPWASVAERWIALDDSTQPGAVQLWRLEKGQNVLRERVRSGATVPRNVFLYKWCTARGRYGMGIDTLLIGWNPRLWNGGGAEATGTRELVDGDEFTYAFLLAPPATDRPSAITWITLDLGIPLALDSLVFFPPQNGFYKENVRFRDLYPAAYEVSRTNQVIDWLLFEDETAATGSSAYHALPEVVASTYSNDQSVVSISMVPRFTRFVRLRLGGVKSTSVLSEIKAYGQGFAQEGRFLSKPHWFGRAVSLGDVKWSFRKFRLGADGRLVEDPTAPVRLTLRTRAGTDADPNAYYVYDELGRQVRVEAAEYYKAFAPRAAYEEGLPGFRAALTDDVGHWNEWSIAYQNPGDANRSSDGREYFQFQFQIATDDPYAVGVLDSLSFQVSPLLADSVVAEVSLAGSSGSEPRSEVRLGQDTVFVFDMRAVFAAAGRPGFDAIALHVPAGTQFLDLEVNGVPAIAGQDFTLAYAADEGLMRFAFPAPFLSDTAFRFRYRCALYSPSVYLGGEVENRSGGGTLLPQAIEAGNARNDVATNSTQVVAAARRVEVLGDVEVNPAAFTPNGDGVNDRIQVIVPVFGVQSARVEVLVRDLHGRRVAMLRDGSVGAGRLALAWDGRGDGGGRVAPGVYLISAKLDVDRDTYVKIRPVAVAF